MLASELIKKVVDEKQAYLFKEVVRNIPMEKGEPFQYDVMSYSEAKNVIGWVILDLFTASAMLAVYNALSEDKRPLYDQLSFMKLVDFTWKHVK